MTVAKLPPRFIHNVEATADCLASKAKQLVPRQQTLQRTLCPKGDIYFVYKITD